jgi:hypothetical protein
MPFWQIFLIVIAYLGMIVGSGFVAVFTFAAILTTGSGWFALGFVLIPLWITICLKAMDYFI